MLVIYKDCNKMDGQQNVKFRIEGLNKGRAKTRVGQNMAQKMNFVFPWKPGNLL